MLSTPNFSCFKSWLTLWVVFFCFLWFMRHESWFMIYYARPFLFMSLLQWCFWCWDGSILFVLSHSWFLITVFGFCLFLEIQLALKLVGVFNLSFCPSIGPSFVGYAVVVVVRDCCCCCSSSFSSLSCSCFRCSVLGDNRACGSLSHIATWLRCHIVTSCL